MSMKPGETTRRATSTRRFDVARERSPVAAMRSPTIPRSVDDASSGEDQVESRSRRSSSRRRQQKDGGDYPGEHRDLIGAEECSQKSAC